MERSLPKLMVDYAARMNSCWMSVYDGLDLQVRFGKTRQVLNLRLNVQTQRMNVPLLACLSVSLKVGVMMPESAHSPLLCPPFSTLNSSSRFSRSAVLYDANVNSIKQ